MSNRFFLIDIHFYKNYNFMMYYIKPISRICGGDGKGTGKIKQKKYYVN